MKINTLLSLLALTIIMLITGCSTSENKVKIEKVGELDNAPSWVKTKQEQGSISEVASAKKSTHSFTQQRDAAISKAEENLAKKVRVKILEVFKLLSDTNEDKKLYQKQVSIATDKILINASKNAKTLKLWQSNTKTIYVLVSTDIQKIKNDLKISVSTTFKDMPAISSNYSLELEQGNIDITLSN